MKKIYKVAAIATPVTIAASSIGIYLAISMNDNEVRVTRDSEDSVFSIENVYDHYKVFPKIKQEDFYNKIKIIKGKAIIDDEMISKIVNYVFDHMEIAQGSVGYEVSRKGPACVVLSFKWNSSSKTYSHSYKINLEQIQ